MSNRIEHKKSHFVQSSRKPTHINQDDESDSDNEKKKELKIQKKNKDSYSEESDESEDSENEDSKSKIQKKESSRKTSPYIVFCNEKRPGIKEICPHLSFGQVGNILSLEWSQLSEKEKKKYSIQDDDSDSDNEDNKPKIQKKVSSRKTSPYIIFCNEKSPEIKEICPHLSFGQVGKILSWEWSELTQEEKESYNN